MSTFCSIIRCNKEKGYDNRPHFHQLFYQLRVTQNSAYRDVIEQDLGYFVNLLGNGQKHVEKAHDVWQLFHHPRHRIVEKRHQRDCVDNLLHGAPQIPFLRPGREAILSGRDPLGSSSKKLKSSGWGVWGSVAVKFISWPHTPALAIVCPREEFSLPGPLRRSSAHVAAMSGAVAADVGLKLLKRAAR